MPCHAKTVNHPHCHRYLQLLCSWHSPWCCLNIASRRAIKDPCVPFKNCQLPPKLPQVPLELLQHIAWGVGNYREGKVPLPKHWEDKARALLLHPPTKVELS